MSQPERTSPVERPPDEAANDGVRPSSGRPRSRRREAAFALAALGLVLGLGEAVLRVVGFRFEPVPILVDGGWGAKQIEHLNVRAQRRMYQPDDLLIWSLAPGLRYDIRTAGEQGILNDPIVVPKPEGTFRVICLGDSCTAMGPAAYPTLLQKKLDILRAPDRRFDVIGAGVFSYSSLQGLRLYRDRLGDVQPDLVTVYYGWNDLFLAGKYPDKMLRSRSGPPPLFLRLLRQLRLHQFVRSVMSSAERASVSDEREQGDLLRVSPEDYRKNLAAMVELARRQGARALLLTCPSNLQPGQVPRFYVENRQVKNGEAMIAHHREYNEIVREVAASRGAELLDLAQRFDAHPKAALFLADAIHPNLAGRHLIADLLVAKMVRMGILADEAPRRMERGITYDSRVPHLLRSRITPIHEPLRALAGQPLRIAVEVENTGDTLWLARTTDGVGEVRVEFQVYNGDGETVLAQVRAPLPHDVSPGERATVQGTLGPLSMPGQYLLSMIPIAGDVAWFHSEGDRRTTATVTIEPSE